MLAFYLSVVPMSEEESDTFIKIYETYLPLMSKIASKYLPSKYDQEDAVQNAMLAIARNIKKLQDPQSDSVRIYITKVVKSAAIDLLRENNRHRYIAKDFDLRDNGEEMPNAVAAENIYDQLVAFIKTLPPQYVDPLTLFIVLELTPQEIAMALGRSANTVRTQLRRGQAMIRKKFSGVIKL